MNTNMPSAARQSASNLPAASPLVIIGAGISGLSAAWELLQSGCTDFLVLEAGAQAGGVLRTEIVNGFVMEAGPDSFLTQKKAAAELCHQLGLGDDLIGCNEAGRGTCILRRGRLHTLPEGWQMLAPARLLPAVTTPLLSVSTKLLIALEWLRITSPRGRAGEDESVAAFVRRHFGSEVVDVIAGPLLAGVYGGDPEQLSLPTVMPRFAELEQQGNLIRALMKSAKAGQRQKPAGAAPAPIFTSLRRGLGSLADTLAERIGSERLRTGVAVESLSPEGAGYRLQLQEGRTLLAERVLLALPAWISAALLEGLDAELVAALSSIPYASSMTVNLAFAHSLDLPDGFGFLAPRAEGRRLMACTFVHRKFPHRAPAGASLLRVFYGGATDPGVIALSDQQAVELSRQELQAILGVDQPPVYTQVNRWHRAMAQYNLGHAQRVRHITARLQQHPRLRLSGNAWSGIGIPDCIENGRRAARELLAAAGNVRTREQSQPS